MVQTTPPVPEEWRVEWRVEYVLLRVLSAVPVVLLPLYLTGLLQAKQVVTCIWLTCVASIVVCS